MNSFAPHKVSELNSTIDLGLAHGFVPHGGIALGLYLAFAALLFAGGLTYGFFAIQPLREGESGNRPALCFLAALALIFCGAMICLPLI